MNLARFLPVVAAGMALAVAGCSGGGGAPTEPGSALEQPPQEEDSYPGDICSGNSPYRHLSGPWGDRTPVFRFSSSLPVEWRDPLEWSGSVWNSVDTAASIRVNRSPVSRTAGLDGVNVISHEPVEGDALGVTYVWTRLSTQTIVEADIVFNSLKPIALEASTDTFDFRAIAVHEFGHFLGLGHVGDRTQTMYPTTSRNSRIQRTLCSGDILGLRVLY